MNMYKHMYHALFLVWFFFLPGCFGTRPLVKKITIKPIQKKPAHLFSDHSVITVYIPGSAFCPPTWFRTCYNSNPGLKHIGELPVHGTTYAWLESLCNCEPDFFYYDTMYLFGWSGGLTVRHRDHAAQALYDALVERAENHEKTYGIWPTFRIITHSHGGNVALSLARFHAQKNANILIRDLILLACPVQLSTDLFARSPLFKNVYSFYSRLDVVQLIAPEITEYIYDECGNVCQKIRHVRLFSNRFFSNKLPVKQAGIKLNGRSLIHSSFTTKKFLCTLPYVLPALDATYAAHGQEIRCGCKNVLCSIYEK